MKPIISKNCRIRYPELFFVGENSVIDDFCYFSVEIRIGEYCHIASGTSIAGGRDKLFTLGDFCSLSAGVRIWCESNDYVNDLIILKPEGIDIGDKPVSGNIAIGEMCGVGSNTVIMPGNHVPEGVAIGALSYVPPHFSFKPWSVYAGVPVKLISPRNKQNVLKQVENFKREIEKKHLKG